MFKKDSKPKRKPIISFSKKILYHGTPYRFKEIDLRINRGTPLDFGRGFYTTEDRAYAESYAALGASNRGQSRGYIRIYQFDEDRALDRLDVGIFDEPDDRWLDHLVSNRIEPYMPPVYDISMGLSADSAIQDVIDSYEMSVLKRQLDRQITIDLLEPYVNSKQIVFHTPRSIKEPYLKYKGYAKVYVDTIEDKG